MAVMRAGETGTENIAQLFLAGDSVTGSASRNEWDGPVLGVRRRGLDRWGLATGATARSGFSGLFRLVADSRQRKSRMST